MNQLKAYSEITGDVLDLGPATDDVDALLGLGEMMATNRDSLIVFTERPVPLQKWEPSDE
jgi:hypothetical protein